ncbi:hypothetical protein JCM1841_002102 [Sporobolomyces salmonicolor]
MPSPSTFVIQPIPPFKPRPSAPPSALPPPLASSTGSSSTSTSTALAAPPASASSRRFSTGGAGGGSYPSVFELPNPAAAQKDASMSSKAETGLGITGVRGVPGGRTAEGHGGGGSRKRKVVVEDEGEHGEARTREANGVVDDDDHCRIDSDPDLAPRPPPLVKSESATSMHSHPSRLSSSPSQSCRDLHRPPTADRDSPTFSKRARTSLGPLDSLATTASHILSTSAPAASPAGAARSPAPTHRPVALPASTQMQSSAVFESARALKDQQQREIERRRAGASSQPLPAPVGALGAALGILKGNQAEREQERARGRDKAEEGGGLAKRRGHRPPAVSTALRTPSGGGTGGGGGAPYEEALRGIGIPSVLVGSPVEASWGARMAREGTGSSSRRSSAVGGGGVPYPSVREPPPQQQQQQPRQPPLVSSSTSYIRPSQPLGPGVSFASALNGGGTQERSSSNHLNPPHSAHPHSQQPPHPGPRLPPLSQVHPRQPPPHSHPYPHPHQQQHSHAPSPPPHPGPHMHHLGSAPASASSAYGPISPLPTALPSLHPHPHPHSTYPHLSHPHPYAPSSAGSLAPQQHQPPPPPPPPPPTTTTMTSTPPSASKTAFLSLFAAFYDALADSRVLSATLDAQVQRAASLLQTLRRSEAVFDAMLERESEWRERCDGLARRVEEVEARVAGGAGSTGAEGAVEARVDRLEKIVWATGPGRAEGGPPPPLLPTPQEDEADGPKRRRGGTTGLEAAPEAIETTAVHAPQ